MITLNNPWISSLLSTALISVAPLIILILLPDLRKNQPLLNILLAFAAGGLLGDAFIHLIPHATVPHSHTHSPASSSSSSHEDNHHHDHGLHDNVFSSSSSKHDSLTHSHSSHSHSDLAVGTWIIVGIITFLCIEKCVWLYQSCSSQSHSHSDLSADGEGKEIDSSCSPLVDTDDIQKGEEKEHTDDNLLRKRVKGSDSRDVISGDTVKTKTVDESQPFLVAGYLNLIADFTHNFTDGLAIGVSYLVGSSVGVVTTITILFHEVPHEIGDYAILIQSGCSRKMAMGLQLFTALGAFLGTICGLYIESAAHTSTGSWVLPFTAGGFIYIATVSILPELLKEKCSLSQSLKEMIFLLLGVGMMYIIALYE